MFDQRLFLELSTGPVLSPLVKAVNLNTWHVAGRCNAVVVWLKGQDEPRYFPHGSADADTIEAWAATQLREQFLHLPWLVLASDSIACMGLSDTDTWVQLEGDSLRFEFSGNTSAQIALLLWAGEDVTELLAAILD